MAVDAVFDSVSVATTFKEQLAELGIIFCSFSEAVREHPDLVKKYLGSVVPASDNFFAALNSAVFSDGSFCYVPKGVRCPMELSTYFRINAKNTGQFERTLIIADEGATSAIWKAAPRPCATPTSFTPPWSNWWRWTTRRSSIPPCRTGIPATRKARAASTTSSPSAASAWASTRKISWTQVETGSAITWKYPSCILLGDNSVGEFYSVALTNNYQQADTGTKMIHIGKNTRSTIVSKGISAGHGQNTYRGAGEDPERRHRRAQLFAMRFAAAGRQVRRAHVPVSGSEEHHGAGGARSLHFEDRRGPDLLLPPARHLQRKTPCP